MPFIGNPRKIDPKDMKKLRRSLREFGFVDPIIARSSDHMVIGGHQRLEAAKAEQWADKVPVVLLDDIDDDRAALLNIALNRINAEFDWPKLGDLLGELDTGGVDLTLSGFETEAIENLMCGLDESEKPEKGDSIAVKHNLCPECGYDLNGE